MQNKRASIESALLSNPFVPRAGGDTRPAMPETGGIPKNMLPWTTAGLGIGGLIGALRAEKGKKLRGAVRGAGVGAMGGLLGSLGSNAAAQAGDIEMAYHGTPYAELSGPAKATTLASPYAAGGLSALLGAYLGDKAITHGEETAKKHEEDKKKQKSTTKEGTAAMALDRTLLTKAAKVYEAAESVEGVKPKEVYESHKKCAPGEFGMNKEGQAKLQTILARTANQFRIKEAIDLNPKAMGYGAAGGGLAGALGGGLAGLLSPGEEEDENGRVRRKSRLGAALRGALGGGALGAVGGAGLGAVAPTMTTDLANAGMSKATDFGNMIQNMFAGKQQKKVTPHFETLNNQGEAVSRQPLGEDRYGIQAMVDKNLQNRARRQSAASSAESLAGVPTAAADLGLNQRTYSVPPAAADMRDVGYTSPTYTPSADTPGNRWRNYQIESFMRGQNPNTPDPNAVPAYGPARDAYFMNEANVSPAARLRGIPQSPFELGRAVGEEPFAFTPQ